MEVSTEIKWTAHLPRYIPLRTFFRRNWETLPNPPIYAINEMEDGPAIAWRVAEFEGNYSNLRYAKDRMNINEALAAVHRLDVAASADEERNINQHLTQPVTPDSLDITIEERARLLCKSGTTSAPIIFHGCYRYGDMNPSEGATSMYIKMPTGLDPSGDLTCWSGVGYDWKARIGTLNKVPSIDRGRVQFRFQVTFGNQGPGLNWSVEQWMETIIHEIGIRKSVLPQGFKEKL